MTTSSGPRIKDLPEIVAGLPDDSRTLFEAIYSLRRDEGRLRIPPEMASWVEERFGTLEDVQTQRIIRILNRYTSEGTIFNALRARRPLTGRRSDAERLSLSQLDSNDDPLANPLALTPDNLIERIRGRGCVTAANVAMADAWHALVVFDEPDPLRFDASDVEDYLSTAQRWSERVHDYDEDAIFPFVFWNAQWRAGASLVHGHAQVILAKGEPYGHVGATRRAASHFFADQESDYFQALHRIHQALGLTVDLPDTVAFAHVTPIKEKEVILIGTALGADFYRAIGRVLVVFRDALGVESFNLAVYGPPLDNASDSWAGFPAIARIVDRGSLDVQTSDIAAMELYGQSVVASDPFHVAAALRGAL